MIISFFLNGQPVESDAPPHRKAVDFLREDFQMKSLHTGCSDALCGSCLIMVDDQPILSCMLPAFELRFRDIWTMEGLSTLKGFANITAGFKGANAVLCTLCAPARALALESLLRRTLRPTSDQAREAAESVRCECCSTRRVLDGILRASRIRERRLHG
jgi:aerobic-type carbon monoxide dehydrogenase small subunit (CoxS/CutS family)